MKRKSTSIADIIAPLDGIIARLDEHRSILMAQVREIDVQLARFGHSSNGKRAKSAKTTKAKGKRKRQSREQLEGLAKKVVTFIASKKDTGATGREIKQRFGALLPSVNVWVKKYNASPSKVTTKGEKANMKYFV